jgi:excisionase family DNA binding protein
VREVTRLRRLVDLDSGRVGKVNEFRAHLALADLCGLSLRPASHQGLVTRCWELRESLTAYDASYIALAEMLGATLVTTDVRMSSASQRLRTVADWRRPDWHQLPSTARTPWHPAITGLPDVRRPPSTAIRFRRRGKSTEARDRWRRPGPFTFQPQPEERNDQRARSTMTITDLSEMLGVPVDTLYGWRHRGEGPEGYRTGRHVQYRRAAVEAWLDTQADRRQR